ncbi:hypothetical protein DFA_10145 [Cavenderia fasciculata]|uniref:Uncharacterized protein n=1 Tax=Cavenderia fasciculata TaxID=261658 RepID=F4Q9E2_CACFS|nr:uncharacterized protein DFA_10145 [Cavenderia fasciculata]EGG15311.1 hypothetical protein DFA_10145 [Cavenderia fasciculata]|eukprot:XP_004352031.1 hypothetical protein DFA_10145 [Cavenderia fasciculata]
MSKKFTYTKITEQNNNDNNNNRTTRKNSTRTTSSLKLKFQSMIPYHFNNIQSKSQWWFYTSIMVSSTVAASYRAY